MADPNVETKVEGVSRLTAADVNEIVGAIVTKYDSDDVGTSAGKLVALDATSKIPLALLPDGIGSGGGGGTGNLVGPGGTTSTGRVAVFADTGGVNLTQGQSYALMPAPGSDGEVPVASDGAWVSGPIVAEATVTTNAIATAIDAETNEITDLSLDTFVAVSQGSVAGTVNIGGDTATYDPNTVATFDALGKLQTTSYTGFAAFIGLGSSDAVAFGTIDINGTTQTLTSPSNGDLSIEGNIIYRAGGTDVPVADGGTGASTAAAAATNLGLGTGDSPQFTAVNIGAATDTTVSRASAGVLSVEGVPLYSNVPQNSQSAAYTLVLADAGKHIFHPSADTTARIWTIPANASVAFPIGTAITFINQHSAGVITLAITSDTLRFAGVGSTGSRTLAADGIATMIKITSTIWIISGVGLT